MPIPNFENWMWAEACEILDRADRLQRQFFRPTIINVSQATWEPPIDIYETDECIKILVALPGIVPEQLKVKLEDRHLLIAGHRHLPTGDNAHIRRLEIPYGRFERHIELPCVGAQINAREFVNGCLLISLRKL